MRGEGVRKRKRERRREGGGGGGGERVRAKNSVQIVNIERVLAAPLVYERETDPAM